MSKIARLFQRLLSPPVLPTEAETQRARTLHGILGILVGIVAFFLSALIVVQPSTFVRRGQSILVVVGLALIALELSRRGRTRLASWGLVIGLGALVTWKAWGAGGASSPVMTFSVMLVMIAGVLLGARASIVTALGAAAVGLIMVLAEERGVLPAPEFALTPAVKWVYTSLWLSMTVLFQREVARAFERLVKRAEHARQRLTAAVDVAAIGVWDFNFEVGRFTADRRLFELYAIPFTPDGSIAFGEWLARIHPEDRERAERAMTDLDDGALSDARLDFRIVHPDGRVRHIAGAAKLALGEAPGERRIVGVNIDVTHEKEAARLTIEKEAAERTSRAKGTFLAHMSHEIRTPMNAILGYAQLLLRDPALAEAQRRKVDVINSSGRHLLRLINDVLEMSRIEAGRATVVAAPFDLWSTLEEVESMFAVLAAPKGIELRFERGADLPRVLEADGSKVKQVVINLLSNGVKFTPKGRISVRATASALAAERCTIRIEVEDTGIGVDAKGLARLFGAFEQVGAGARSGGTGLGLSISRNFARMMGGDITVRSAPGEGSVFTFTCDAKVVPESALPDRGARRRPAALAAGERQRKILVVDDEPTNREILIDLLSRFSFETRIATTGEEAIEVHDVWRPDLALMDLRMPGMGGFEATRHLRASGSTCAIIVLTASSLDDAEPEALAAGANLFMRKPYDDVDLLTRIGESLGVRYVYEEEVGVAPQPAVAARPLADLVQEIPPDLIAELREAAASARAERLEQLARRVGQHSEAAAAGIREAAQSFRYDILLAALDSGGQPRTPAAR